MALELKLTKNDGSEQFTFQGEVAGREIDNGFVTRSIISAVGDAVRGADPVLNLYTVDVTARIQDVEAGHYPNSGSYSDHDEGFEQEIIRAAQEWGPDSSDGFDELTWGPRTISVVITNCQTEENRREDPNNVFSLNLELTHASAYIG